MMNSVGIISRMRRKIFIIISLSLRSLLVRRIEIERIRHVNAEVGAREEIPDSVFDSDVLDEDEFAQFEKELMDTEEESLADMDLTYHQRDLFLKMRVKQKNR